MLNLVVKPSERWHAPPSGESEQSCCDKTEHCDGGQICEWPMAHEPFFEGFVQFPSQLALCRSAAGRKWVKCLSA